MLYSTFQFFPGDSKLRLGWLHGVAEMGIQQAKQDPSPTKIEPLVALLDRLGCVISKVFVIQVFSYFPALRIGGEGLSHR